MSLKNNLTISNYTIKLDKDDWLNNNQDKKVFIFILFFKIMSFYNSYLTKSLIFE